MPSYCLKQSGMRKNKNQPKLTLHRFPGNEILKKKWIEAIGFENTNPRHKMWQICSMHFEESCFNRTLDVIRLPDGVVPTSTLLGLKVDELASLETKFTNLNLINSKQENFFEVDTQGINVLNILCGDDFNYRIRSQSMAMEKTNIGGRTIQVQKLVWTLSKQEL